MGGALVKVPNRLPTCLIGDTSWIFCCLLLHAFVILASLCAGVETTSSLRSVRCGALRGSRMGSPTEGEKHEACVTSILPIYYACPIDDRSGFPPPDFCGSLRDACLGEARAQTGPGGASSFGETRGTIAVPPSIIPWFYATSLFVSVQVSWGCTSNDEAFIFFHRVAWVPVAHDLLSNLNHGTILCLLFSVVTIVLTSQVPTMISWHGLMLSSFT